MTDRQGEPIALGVALWHNPGMPQQTSKPHPADKPTDWQAVADGANAAERLITQISQLHRTHPRARHLDNLLLEYLRILNARPW